MAWKLIDEKKKDFIFLDLWQGTDENRRGVYAITKRTSGSPILPSYDTKIYFSKKTAEILL